MIELSVVLISKNQAWNISRLIESVLTGTSCVSEKEIILVDSASTDETVELASRYPVTILRLQPGQRLSPAIGRYVGYKQTRGEYVLFLDGDTQLFPDWLSYALGVIRAQSKVGAVTGVVRNLPTSAAGQVAIAPVQNNQMGPPKRVLWCNYGGGGAALYRRAVLEKVGTFNPYLSSEEEPELGLRVRHAGYRILELSCPMAYHFNDAPVALSTPLSRRRRNFHLGMGQAARYHFGTKLFWPWLKERWWEPAAVLLFASGLAALLTSLVSLSAIWFGSWILAFTLLVASVALRKQSVPSTLVAVFGWCVMAEGFIKGFFKKPISPDSFNAKAEAARDLRHRPAMTAAR